MEETTKKCPKCREEVDISATKCKHCGADLRNWFSRHIILSVILVFVVIGIIVAVIGGGDNDSKSTTTTPASTKTDTVTNKDTNTTVEEIIEISASELYEQYDNNEVAADERYEGKLLKVTGEIESIGKDILDDPYITLSGGSMFNTVQCMLSKDEESKAAELSTGESVTLQGEGNGFLLMNVMLKECVIL